MEDRVTLQDLMTAFNDLMVSYDTIATLYAAILAAITVFINIVIQIFLSRRKNNEVKEAITEVVQKISSDEKLRTEFVRALVQSANLRQNARP